MSAVNKLLILRAMSLNPQYEFGGPIFAVIERIFFHPHNGGWMGRMVYPACLFFGLGGLSDGVENKGFCLDNRDPRLEYMLDVAKLKTIRPNLGFNRLRRSETHRFPLSS